MFGPRAFFRGFFVFVSICFLLVLLQFPPAFCIHKPSSATKLAKKEKHLVLSPLRGAFLSFKLLCRMSLPGARPQDLLHTLCFFLGMSYARFFFSFCIHKPSSATKLAKKRNTWFCLRCAGLLCLSNYYLGCRCLVLVAQDFLHGLCFFFGVLLQFFLAFGSGSLHRLQGLQKKNIREEPTKQRRALSNVLAQDFVQRLCFFLGGLPPVFCFGSGSLHRLLR